MFDYLLTHVDMLAFIFSSCARQVVPRCRWVSSIGLCFFFKERWHRWHDWVTVTEPYEGMLPINWYSSSTGDDFEKKKKKHRQMLNIIIHPSFRRQNEHCHQRLLSGWGFAMLSDSSQPHSPRLLQCLTSTKTTHTRKKSSHTLVSLYPSLLLTHRHTHRHTHTHQGYSKFLFVFIFFLPRAQIKEIIECVFLAQWPFLWKSSSSSEKPTNGSHRADTWSTGEQMGPTFCGSVL